LSTLTKIIIKGWHLPSKLKTIYANNLNKDHTKAPTVLEILIFRNNSKSAASDRNPLDIWSDIYVMVKSIKILIIELELNNENINVKTEINMK